jgi:hypothetical protein
MKFGFNIFAISVSLIIGLFAFWILNLPLIESAALSLVSSLLTFFLIHYLVSDQETSFSIRFKPSCFAIIVIVLSVLSTLAVFLVPSNSEVLFVNWNSIASISWLRFTAAIVLLYVPGVLVFRLIDSKHRFGNVERFVLSFLLSCFIVSVTAYVSYILNVLGQENLILISLDWVLIAFYILKNKPFLTNSEKAIFKFDICKVALVLSLLIFVLLSAILIRNYADALYCLGDMRNHVGAALSLLNGNAVIAGSSPTSSQELGFHLIVASYVQLTGLPAFNAYSVNTLLLLFVVPFLAIYALASAFFKKSKIPVLAALFAVFGGFGWIYFTLLRGNSSDPITILGFIQQANVQTNDIFNPILFPTMPVPFYIISIPIFCMLTATLRFEGFKDFRYFFLVSILVVLDIFTHAGAELIIFFAALVCFFLLNWNRKLANRISFFIIIGLAISLLLDLMGGRYVTFLGSLGQTTPYGVLFAAAVTLFLSSYIHLPPERIFATSKRTLQKLKPALVSLGLYLLGLSFIIASEWSSSYPYGSVLWYLVPVMIGIPLLLTASFIFYLTCTKSKINKFFLFFSLVALISLGFIEIFRNSGLLFPNLFANIESTLASLRFDTYIKIGLCISGSFVMVGFLAWLKQNQNNFEQLNKSFYRLHVNKKIVASLVIAVFVLLCLPSALLRTEGFSIMADSNQPIPNNALDAMQYVVKYVPQTDQVMVLSINTYSLLDSAGISRQQLVTTPIATNTQGLVPLIDFISTRGTKFIFATESEVNLLKQEYPSSSLVQTLQYLPIAFSEGDISVYEMPTITASVPADTVLAVPFPETSANDNITYFFPLWMCALSNLKYNVLSDVDNDIFNYSTIILSHDIQEKGTAQRFLDWVKAGGNLIVLGSSTNGQISNQLSINNAGKTETDGIVSSKGTSSMPQIDLNKTYSSSPETQVQSSFSRNGVAVTPLSYSQSFGVGKIVYIDSYSIFSSFQSNKLDAFEILSRILTLNDIQSLGFTSTQEIEKAYSYKTNTNWFEQETDFTGNITINSNFLSIPYQAPLYVNQLDFSSSQILSNNSFRVASAISNISICSIEFNNTAGFTLTTNQVRILPSSLNQYTLISLSSEYQIDISLNENTELSLVLNDGKVTTKLTVAGGLVSLNGFEPPNVKPGDLANINWSNQDIILKSPSVLDEGQSDFTGNVHIFSQKTWDKLIFPYAPLHIKGKVSFIITYSSDSYTIISNFSYNGTFKSTTAQNSVAMTTEMNVVPWVKVLASQYNIILILALALFGLFFSNRIRLFSSKKQED